MLTNTQLTGRTPAHLGQSKRVYFVGVDLAWGERKPTGVAVVDDTGRLVHIGAAQDDASIKTAIAPYVQGDCLVAFDAPLVVTNPTGQRPSEAALNRDFAKFEAGRAPHEHRQGRVRRHATRRPARQSAGPRHRSAVAVRHDGPSRSTRTRRRSRCSGSAEP